MIEDEFEEWILEIEKIMLEQDIVDFEVRKICLKAIEKETHAD